MTDKQIDEIVEKCEDEFNSSFPSGHPSPAVSILFENQARAAINEALAVQKKDNELSESWGKDVVECLRLENKRQQQKLDKLREFARRVLNNGFPVKTAVELGLVEIVKVKKEPRRFKFIGPLAQEKSNKEPNDG